MIYVAISAFHHRSLALTLAMLECQDCGEFEVIVIDPGWEPSVREIIRFSSLKFVHVIPYKVPPYPRHYDWGQWNSAMLVPESDEDRVFRFPSYRIIPNNAIREMKGRIKNIAFSRAVRNLNLADQWRHILNWRAFHAADTPELRNNGDWCVRVGDFITVNGIDEPWSAMWHSEDVEMGQRWQIALSNNLFQLGAIEVYDFLFWLSAESRILIGEPLTQITRMREAKKFVFDHHFMAPCPRCAYTAWTELQYAPEGVSLEDVPNNEGMLDLGTQWGKRWFVCTICGAPISHTGCPRLSIRQKDKEHRATMGLCGKYGRDLRTARRLARQLPMAERLRFIADSYEDPSLHFDYAPYRARCVLDGLGWGLIDELLEKLPAAGCIVEWGCRMAGLAGYLAKRLPNRRVYAFEDFQTLDTTADEIDQWFFDIGATGADVAHWDSSDNSEFDRLSGIGEAALAIIDPRSDEATLSFLKWVWPRIETGGFVVLTALRSHVTSALDFGWTSRLGCSIARKR